MGERIQCLSQKERKKECIACIVRNIEKKVILEFLTRLVSKKGDSLGEISRKKGCSSFGG